MALEKLLACQAPEDLFGSILAIMTLVNSINGDKIVLPGHI
jgi:hypothetical protein